MTPHSKNLNVGIKPVINTADTLATPVTMNRPDDFFICICRKPLFLLDVI